MRLPDPRCYAAANDDPFVAMAAAAQRPGARQVLIKHLCALLEAGDDAAIQRTLQSAPSAMIHGRLCDALAEAIEQPGAEAQVLASCFAIPLLLVTGGMAPASIPGILPGPVRIESVLQNAGALGPTRSFSLTASLSDAAAVEAMMPSHLYRASRNLAPGQALDLPPCAVAVESASEAAHLRFLSGVALTPAHSPSFLATGANIGAWGLPLTRELGEQLAVPELSLLVIPRPPVALFRAPWLGSFAREELDFQLFLSRSLREFRARVGEPEVSVAALDDASIGVRLSSALDPGRVAAHRWPLHPRDDLEQISTSVLGLLQECRATDLSLLDKVQSAGAFLASSR